MWLRWLRKNIHHEGPLIDACTHPHWRKAISMCPVWQTIFTFWTTKNTRAHTYRREALQVRRLREVFHRKWQPQDAHENSHRWEAIPLRVQGMQSIVHNARPSDGSPAKAYQHPPLCLRHLWMLLHAFEHPLDAQAAPFRVQHMFQPVFRPRCSYKSLLDALVDEQDS